MQALVRWELGVDFEDALRDRTAWRIGDGCSMTRVLDLLSAKTSFQVIRELFFGTSRFDDFVDRTGSSAPAVSRALKQLEAAGIVDRVGYREPGSRVRDEYRLTAAGEDLLPVFMALVQWGDEHLQGGHPRLTFVDSDTGRAVGVRVDAADAPALHSADIEVRRNMRSHKW
jgi:DNA-binding HxlR family transcriptional regulator